MSNEPDDRPERRRSTRFSLKGAVVLQAGAQPQRARIENLSRGGLLVATEATASEALLEQTVNIELRLDGTRAEWIRITGTVRRIDEDALAIEIETAPPSFFQLVDDNENASYRHQQGLSVILVDATVDRRLAIAEAFRAAGCSVVDVSTPLEAIVRLGESQFEPDLVVVANSLPTTTADELRRFVQREHPAATLVTVGDELVEPAGLLHWLSSANPGDDVIARVRELLSRPLRR